MSHRANRLAETIKKEISSIIHQGLKDPCVGFASVIAVDVVRDLRHAKIYISVLGDANQKKDTLVALERARGFIRTELGRRIKLRYTPELQFELDDSINHATKIMKLLREVNQEGN
ncbi:MAG: 30S ribosome-binding factor RbfA [Desulfotomaculum sp.]|nr:30S ribosome-binding factor RbfA [Desulfotomaculum sp.]